jgi:transcriptional regulator with XRE-family HTH domain
VFEQPPLGEVLRSARRAVGLTQDEAAKRLGVGLNTVARWEQGVATPTDENLTRALELYETDIDEIPYGPQRRKWELRVELLERRAEQHQDLVKELRDLRKTVGEQQEQIDGLVRRLQQRGPSEG